MLERILKFFHDNAITRSARKYNRLCREKPTNKDCHIAALYLFVPISLVILGLVILLFNPSQFQFFQMVILYAVGMLFVFLLCTLRRLSR